MELTEKEKKCDEPLQLYMALENYSVVLRQESRVLTLGCSVYCEVIEIPGVGKVAGSVNETTWTRQKIYQYFSIPYAKSPSGDLRFAEPVPASPWQDTYNATKQRRACPSIYNDINTLREKSLQDDIEDCLTLNVFTRMKNRENGTKLSPVLIYIHGGKFLEGTAGDFFPNNLLEHHIVLVVIQYRLGALGTLSLQTDRIAGNMGLLDQLLAIKWVNKNIEHFGGDKDQVTLSGHSSGAFSVSAHLLSPLVDENLFHRAIVQSGATYTYWGVYKDPVEYAKDLYKFLKNESENNIAVIEQAFIDAPLADFISANLKKINNDSIFDADGIAIQTAGKSKYLTEDTIVTLKKGKRRSLPLLTGVVKEDGSIYTYEIYEILKSLNKENNDTYLRNDLVRDILEYCGVIDRGDTLVDLINHQYNQVFQLNRTLNFTDMIPTITDLFSLFVFKSPVLKQAKDNALHKDTYLYTFDYRGQFTYFDDETQPAPFDGGVTHSDELLYLFPNKTLNEEDTKMANLMTGLWASFVIDGKPTSNLTIVTWPTLERGKNGPYLHINTNMEIGQDFVASEYFSTSNDDILNPNRHLFRKS